MTWWIALYRQWFYPRLRWQRVVYHFTWIYWQSTREYFPRRDFEMSSNSRIMKTQESLTINRRACCFDSPSNAQSINKMCFLAQESKFLHENDIFQSGRQVYWETAEGDSERTRTHRRISWHRNIKNVIVLISAAVLQTFSITSIYISMDRTKYFDMAQNRKHIFNVLQHFPCQEIFQIVLAHSMRSQDEMSYACKIGIRTIKYFMSISFVAACGV